LLAGLGIIWLAFLLPARKRSPAATVEDFEERMSLLAGANGSSTGRWVLMPRKGSRFLGPESRQRIRVRRRRRVVFTVLLDATGLTLLMGLFPPFRKILILTAVLGVALLGYTMLLAQLRSEERARDARRRRATRRMQQQAIPERQYSPYRAAAYAPTANGNGNGHARANGNGNGHRVAASNGNGNGNGHRRVPEHAYAEYDPQFSEHGIRIIEDDVHVVVYRSDEIDLRAGSAGG
jgi:hypothetical protein